MNNFTIFVLAVFLLMLIFFPISFSIKKSGNFTDTQKSILIISLFLFLPLGLLLLYIIREINRIVQKKMKLNPCLDKNIVYNKLFFQRISEQEAEQVISNIEYKLFLLDMSHQKGVVSDSSYKRKKNNLSKAISELKKTNVKPDKLKAHKQEYESQLALLNNLKEEGLISNIEYRKNKKNIFKSKLDVDNKNAILTDIVFKVIVYIILSVILTLSIIILSGFFIVMLSIGSGFDNLIMITSIFMSLLVNSVVAFFGIEILFEQF